MESACDVCGAKDFSIWVNHATDYVTGADFSVHCCRECGFGRTEPRPASMQPFYPVRYRKYGPLTKKVLRTLYGWRVRSWARHLPNRGNALEIGCGAGWMLAVLRDRGWDVTGTERSGEELSVATEANGIPILIGGLDKLASSSFDLVILFQVLEHMDDPAATLRRCSELLKPGGNLVVSVPNASSWQARAFARWWFHLDVPRHQHHFSTQALERALLNAQLRVMRKRFVSLEHDPFGLLQSTLNWLGFRQNLLTRLLMGMSENDVSPFMLCAMCLTASALVVPSVLASISTWMLGSGAIQEMWAQKA